MFVKRWYLLLMACLLLLPAWAMAEAAEESLAAHFATALAEQGFALEEVTDSYFTFSEWGEWERQREEWEVAMLVAERDGERTLLGITREPGGEWETTLVSSGLLPDEEAWEMTMDCETTRQVDIWFTAPGTQEEFPDYTPYALTLVCGENGTWEMLTLTFGRVRDGYTYDSLMLWANHINVIDWVPFLASLEEGGLAEAVASSRYYLNEDYEGRGWENFYTRSVRLKEALFPPLKDFDLADYLQSTDVWALNEWPSYLPEGVSPEYDRELYHEVWDDEP